jgi:hypothetical protein
MSEVMAKGVNFVCSKKYINSKYGAETWDRIIQFMPDEAKAVWRGSLLAGNSYPFTAFKDMMSALTRELKFTKEQEIAAIYEYIADQSLTTMHKIFFRILNPSLVIKNYPKLWKMFFNTGTVTVPLAEKGHAVLIFLLPEIFNDWLPPACHGYSKKAVEMAGGKSIVLKKNSANKMSTDLWETVYELWWTE